MQLSLFQLFSKKIVFFFLLLISGMVFSKNNDTIPVFNQFAYLTVSNRGMAVIDHVKKNHFAYLITRAEIGCFLAKKVSVGATYNFSKIFGTAIPKLNYLQYETGAFVKYHFKEKIIQPFVLTQFCVSNSHFDINSYKERTFLSAKLGGGFSLFFKRNRNIGVTFHFMANVPFVRNYSYPVIYLGYVPLRTEGFLGFTYRFKAK